jgi:hypothetical protein
MLRSILLYLSSLQNRMTNSPTQRRTRSSPDPSIISPFTSRPDIAFSVSRLCQFNSKPTFTHLKAARRVLRYAIHMRNYSIKYCGDGFLELELLGFADADYVISSIVGPLRATSSSSAAMRYPDSPGNNRPWRYLRWRPSIWPYLMQFASSFRM